MHDVAIIGGSFAGLTAALQLGRASRSVVVIDAGLPRNRTSPGAHGVAGWDGMTPAEILARFRADLVPYPTVTTQDGVVTTVAGVQDAFALTLSTGQAIAARRIILTHGVKDILPDIPGITQAWGRRVLHCPYCHGYEVKGQPLAVLAVHPMSGHQAMLLRADWSDDVTLFSSGMEGLHTDALTAAGVKLDDRAITRLQGDDTGIGLTLSDAATARFGALFLGPRAVLDGSPAQQLGCALADGPMGPFVRTGPMAQTSVPGVFAAGDVARAAPNINFALGDGAQAGTGAHASLVFPGFITPLEVSS
ncbi:Thioredoxin reductase [Loktanella fryxellensis]|uniref:Thioredoxin reductase n=1 Tax=Loktanella fryxellensis TaxID=245187 RepID=A0A1H8JDD2_9RHOB|nr:NAD(P)/FAD-dependent oxidoreductase [Loktanella fryxellensis]SEN78814.1 Thioredoxin reductase [Loktanella fryxellensis]